MDLEGYPEEHELNANPCGWVILCLTLSVWVVCSSKLVEILIKTENI